MRYFRPLSHLSNPPVSRPLKGVDFWHTLLACSSLHSFINAAGVCLRIYKQTRKRPQTKLNASSIDKRMKAYKRSRQPVWFVVSIATNETKESKNIRKPSITKRLTTDFFILSQQSWKRKKERTSNCLEQNALTTGHFQPVLGLNVIGWG